MPTLRDKEPHEVEHGGASHNIRVAKITAWCGEGRITSSVVDSTFSPCTYHYFCHQAFALPIAHGIPPQHVLGLKAQVLIKCIVRLRELQPRSVKYLSIIE